MSLAIERRLLQAAVALACLVPFSASLAGIAKGAAWLAKAPVATDLDSHFRYLSGIFLALGLAFASCIPAIETKGARFRLLGAMVVTGGLARLGSLATAGVPGPGMLFGFAMELGVVPLLMIWQASLARRSVLSPLPPSRERVG